MRKYEGDNVKKVKEGKIDGQKHWGWVGGEGFTDIYECV
jgi:hypothetical protein